MLCEVGRRGHHHGVAVSISAVQLAMRIRAIALPIMSANRRRIVSQCSMDFMLLMWSWIASEGEAVTVNDNPEQPNLVDVFYHPYVRALGNLVILFAKSGAELLDLIMLMKGVDEKTHRPY